MSKATVKIEDGVHTLYTLEAATEADIPTTVDLVGTQMSTIGMCVRVVYDHNRVGDIPDYHKWVTLNRRIKADCNGKPAPRMVTANWSEYVCNNPDCYGTAWVHDDLVRIALADANHVASVAASSVDEISS